MHTSESTHSGGWLYTVSSFSPPVAAWKFQSYRTAVYHAAGHSDLGREMVAFSLQCLVYLPDVDEIVPAFRSRGPRLDQLEDFGSHFAVDGSRSYGLKEGSKVVHELSGGDFG
jgi:hypothetical protein